MPFEKIFVVFYYICFQRSKRKAKEVGGPRLPVVPHKAVAEVSKIGNL